MSQSPEKKKKKKRQQISFLKQVQEETTVQNAIEVTQALEELATQGIKLEVQVCPQCKSAKVKRAKTSGGDMWGHMGMLPPSYECPECGWQERVVLKATNKRLTVREVELIREAMEIENKETK